MKVDFKNLTIRGSATSYKVSVFRVPTEAEPVQKAGYRNMEYIAMIIWGPKSYLLIDSRGGYAAWSLNKAGIYCPVLEKAWQYILDFYDVIEDGDHLEVSDRGVDLEKGWKY